MSEFTEQNEIVKQWRSLVVKDLKSSTSSFNHGKTGMVMRKGRNEMKLTDSFKGKIQLYYNLANGVKFSFERHGIFILKGVGKGYRSKKNIVTKYSQNPTGHRDKHNWVDPVMDRNVPTLADKIAEINANMAVASFKIRV